MIRSMTGYGKAEETFQERTIRVELRSLNGKQFDIRMKPAPILKPYEIEIRKQLKNALLRGSLEVNIQVTIDGATQPMKINSALAKNYYNAIQELANELGLPQKNTLRSLLELPEVVTPASEELTTKDWHNISKVLSDAIQQLDDHRKDEGNALEADLISHIKQIESYQTEIQKIEPNRKKRIKERLENALEEYTSRENIDHNRLEQELIFYIEKLDISEEQVRLSNHCRYFYEILEDKTPTKGKKLNFLLQEIGREINTTGAKANDADLQRCVVKMKDELDKAKEQIMNVL